MLIADAKKYPSWAPQPVIRLRNKWESLDSNLSLHAAFPRRADILVLDRLLHSKRMKGIWPEISRLTSDSSDEPIANFAYNVCVINHSWKGSSKKTRSELQSDINNSASHAEALANELTELKLDTSTVPLLESAYREKPYANGPPIAEILDFRNAILLPSLVDTLRQYVKFLSVKSAEASPITGQPNRLTAERTHFVRELEGHFRRIFGTPKHAQVGIVTGVNFQCPSLDYTEVGTICRRGRPNV